MAEVMVINPRRRRRRTAKRARSYKRTTRRRRRVALANPVRRRRRRIGRRRANARRRRVYSNPRLGSFMGVNIAQAGGVAVGIIGANLATAAVLNNIPGIPANLKTGPAKILAKAAIGIGVGLLVKKVLKQGSLGNGIMAGGVIAALLDAFATYVAPSLPAQLQDYELAGTGVYELGDGDEFQNEEAVTGFSGGENMYTDTMY
jgi:hypothetical protein